MAHMHANVEFVQKVALAYGAVCKPLCRELGLTQTAFDILLFLANNPSYRTARDIVEVRHIKANLVSVNVDKLVQEGVRMILEAIYEGGGGPPQDGAGMHPQSAGGHPPRTAAANSVLRQPVPRHGAAAADGVH